MKLPLAPKPLDELLARHGHRLPAVLGQGLRPTVGGRYLHWDRLRHRAPPDGLDHEEWWLGVKLSRRSQARSLPLRDTGGRPFSFMLPDPVQAALHRIDSQLRGWIGVPERVANPDTRDRFIIDSLIEEAITSSQLEGASTTRAAAKDMLRAGRRPRDHSERMIHNNYQAMEAVRKIRGEPLTLASVLVLHTMLTADTLDDPEAAGRIQRPGDERVQVVDHRDQRVLHTPPPAEELPDRLASMIRFANRRPQGRSLGDSAPRNRGRPDQRRRRARNSPATSEDGGFLHPVIRAIVLHFWLAYEHPFEDGNGRTARALFYWSMLHHDYWMFEFISISRQLVQAPALFARAFLHTETDGNDLTYFIEHQIGVILRALDDLDAYIERKAAETREVEGALRRATDLNHRQLALLAHALRHPDAAYTIREHRTSHGVVYATARADLLRLAELGLLDRRRAGRKTLVFDTPPDLEARIRALPPAAP